MTQQPPDNFEHYPQSLTERAALTQDNAHLWTPRDALVHLLRQIDAGEIAPKGLMVVYYQPATTRPGHSSNYITAFDDTLLMRGALQNATHKLGEV